ncbi:BMA-ARP-11, isoform a [Aphelenchoides besseyi]|nr:BMA-ARP-11, isoform a [Aphelenchoides besseyi]
MFVSRKSHLVLDSIMKMGLSPLPADETTRKFPSPRRTVSSLSSAATATTKQANTLVIEIGTRFTRIGFTEEFAPREIFRTHYVNPLRPWTSLPLYDPQRDADEQNRIFCAFFRDIFMRKTLKNPSICRVIFVVNPFSTDAYRNGLIRALTKHPSLLPASISFTHSPLMHLIAFNRETALLIDTGVDETQLYPIVDQFLMLTNGFAATPISTSTVEKRIEDLMTIYGRVAEANGNERELTTDDLALFKRLQCAEDICYRFCFATTRERGLQLQEHFFDDSIEIQTPPPSVKIPFGKEMLVVPGIVREGAAESLFTHDSDIPSIPQLVANFIDQTEIDLKRKYAENLLFVGGLSQMKGFLARIRSELLFLFEDDYDQRLSNINKIKFHYTSNSSIISNYSAWLGASLSRNYDYQHSESPNFGLYY